MADNIERIRSVVYKLESVPFGIVTIQEPVGYQDDSRSYDRDKDSRSFIVKTDIDLEFYGNGAEYLYNLFSIYGIHQKCTITKYERDLYDISERFKVRYIQELDLGTLKRDDRTGKVTVNATEGGLYADIKNRISDKYDIIDNFSADGVDIGALSTETFKPVARSLFLESFLKDEVTDYLIKSGRQKSSGSISQTSKTIPLRVVYESGDNVKTPSIVNNSNLQSDAGLDDSNYGYDTEQAIGNQFFYRSDIERTVVLKIDLEFSISAIETFRNGTNPYFTVELRKSRKDGVNDLLSYRKVYHEFDPTANVGVVYSVLEEEELELDEGDSLSIVFTSWIIRNSNINPTATSGLDLLFNVTKSELTVNDYTDYDLTISRCIKPLVLFNRLVSKITGINDLVVSDIFGVGGAYENMVVDNGLWARGFEDYYVDSDGEEQYIQMSTSFKEAFESFNYLEPLCWFTFYEGSTEKIRIEPATYTQQNFIGLDLGYVDDITREVSKVDFFSKITIGHDGSMEYEELNGLDEPNGNSEFSSFISNNDSNYEVLSKYRVDSVGYELARRKPFESYPKEDTSYDDSFFIHDARVTETGDITHNLWNDLDMLDEEPKGVFRGDNLWNFRLSPANRLFYGHGYNVKRGLYHFPNKYITFNSSNSNQNLITVKNGLTLSENGNILIDDLPKPRVEAELINFTFEMTQLIEDKLLDYTKIGNDLVPNYFGLIRFIQNNEYKYGRLVKLTTDDQAKMTLIKARL